MKTIKVPRCPLCKSWAELEPNPLNPGTFICMRPVCIYRRTRIKSKLEEPPKDEES